MAGRRDAATATGNIDPPSSHLSTHLVGVDKQQHAMLVDKFPMVTYLNESVGSKEWLMKDPYKNAASF